jgi:hypothetical protein
LVRRAVDEEVRLTAGGAEEGGGRRREVRLTERPAHLEPGIGSD